MNHADPEAAVIVAELRLFNHHAAADLIDRLVAAPHLMAAAWDEGYLALADDTFRDQELRKRGAELEQPTANPYTHDHTQGEK